MSPVKVLVIEDEPGTRRLLQELLRSRGHEVEACADGETGWRAYQRERHALVLLDLQLPGIDGLEVCRRIRRLPENDETVILFVTGVSRAEALEEALEAGANDYVPKPVDTEEFRVRLSIAERRLRDMRGRKEREANLRHESYRFAVLVVDLWDFAEINRDHGRAVGDSLLKGVAQRLEEAVRSVDSVSRVTADRFAILLDGLADVSDPSRIAVRIHQGLSASFELADEGIRTSACIGIALSAGGLRGRRSDASGTRRAHWTRRRRRGRERTVCTIP